MMTINDQIKDEKLQYNINREAANHQVNSINMNILLVKIYYHQPTTNNRANKIYLFSFR